MADHWAIGIGGTGARCIESLVHLCAAGLGPEKLHVFFVDPDKANGNLSRTRNLIKHYNQCRSMIKKSNDKRMDPLFKTEILISPEDTWNIFDTKGEDTLEKYLKIDTLSASNKNLLKTLFTEDELKTELSVGFRGHPAIGAVVMANPDYNKEPWKSFWENIDSIQQAGEAKVFLFGSIFGGTGAAGFPTLSYTIQANSKNILKGEKGDKTKIHLGGALLLPYFRFKNPSEKDLEHENLFVKVDDFPLAAKAALNYYGEKNLGINDLYFIGDATEIEVGDFSVGAGQQRNASHYIELISALASLDFYKSQKQDNTNYFIAGRDANIRVNWRSLPSSRLEFNLQAQKRIMAYLIIFAEFSYTIKRYILPLLKMKNSSEDNQPWYRKNFKKLKKDPRNSTTIEAIESVENYFDLFIQWAKEISGNNQIDGVELFNVDKLTAEINDDPYAISNLASGIVTDKKFMNFVTVMNKIVVEKNISEPENRLINLVYLAANEFYKINYREENI